MGKMVKLPDGVSVTIGKKKWVGEIPEEICPPNYKPAPVAEKPSK